MSAIQIQHVSRHFGNTIALEDVQLEVKEGEFFSLSVRAAAESQRSFISLPGSLNRRQGLYI